MTLPSFGEIPYSLHTDILSTASGISQQQQHEAQQDQEQAFAVSTRQQQRHLGGFTLVNHRWRLAALSICTGLHVSLKDLSALKQLSSWLRHNGNQLQHLSLDLSGFDTPPSFFSSIPTSTPQLQSLKLRGLVRVTSDISADDASTWGALTRLTCLDVDHLQTFDAPMQYLTNVKKLSVSVSDRSAVEQLSSWLRRNGNQLQHLSLDLSGLPSCCSDLSIPSSFLSIIPSSTPQLQHLKLRGLYCLKGEISADEAAAWGGLTRLTSLYIQDGEDFRAPMQYLDYVEELTVSQYFYNDVATEACKAVQPKLPRLRVLRVQASRNFAPWDQDCQALDILSGKQLLQQVDGMSIFEKYLDHAAVSLFCPSLQIIAYDSIEPVDAWLEAGGGMKLMNLMLYCRSQPCSRSVLANLQGLPLLRRLTLSCVGLGAGAPELQQLTQLTQLHLVGCSPALTSLAQLPQELRELSMDNYAAQLQQQPQHQTGAHQLPAAPQQPDCHW